MVDPNKTPAINPDSPDPVPLKEALMDLVDADFPALSKEEEARKAAANKRDAEHHAQEAREDWQGLQEQVTWEDVDPEVLRHTGQILVEAEAELKSQDPRP